MQEPSRFHRSNRSLRKLQSQLPHHLIPVYIMPKWASLCNRFQFPIFRWPRPNLQLEICLRISECASQSQIQDFLMSCLHRMFQISKYMPFFDQSTPSGGFRFVDLHADPSYAYFVQPFENEHGTAIQFVKYKFTQ
jgi:hypothetical protein